MVKKKLRVIRTDLTNLQDIQPVYSKLRHYIMANTLYAPHNFLDLVGAWRVQVHAELKDKLTGELSSLVVETLFVDKLDFLDALTISVRMWDEEYMETFGVSNGMKPHDIIKCYSMVTLR